MQNKNNTISQGKLFFILILIQVPLGSLAQINLSGKVTDESKTPLYGVNIILTDLQTHSIIDGTVSDENGSFQITNLKKGNYKITLSYIGFKTYKKQIEIENDYDIGTITLKTDPNQLQEVVITVSGDKPIMEMKMDRTVFYVSRSDAAIGGNAIDALRITPGIRIKNAKLELIGKGSVKLMINGRLVRLNGQNAFSYLKSIPSENIDRIELITNPPAKYSAEGSFGLINVVLKKGKGDRFFGIVSASAKQSNKFSHFENASIFYRKNGLQLNGGINYYDSRSKGYFEQTIAYNDYTLKERNTFPVKAKGYGAFAQISYDLSDKTTIGFNVRYYKNPETEANRTDYSNYIRNNQIDSTLWTNSNQNSQFQTQNYSIYLDHKLDSAGSKMSVEASYINKTSDQSLNFVTLNQTTSQNTDVASNGNQQAKLFYAAINFKLDKDFANYNFGAQVQTSSIQSNSFYTNSYLANQDSRFKYDEQIYSAYFSISKQFNEKWGLKLGLRSEYTISKGNSLTLHQITKRDYLELFPTVYLSYDMNTDNSFVLSYGRRINRPGYGYLDPFREYFSPYRYREGNPYLRPAYNNNIELKHIYKNKLSSGLYFSYIPNGYGEITVIDNDSPTIATIRDNYLKTYKFGLVESLYLKPFPWWTSNNQGRVYYSKSTSDNPNTRQELKGFGGYLSTYNSFYLNKDKTFKANFSLNYYFPAVDGVNDYEPYYDFNIGLTGLFFNKKLTLSIQANDIFKTSIFEYSTISNNIPQQFKGYYDSRYVRVSATYKFGNNKNKRERGVYNKNSNRL